MLENIAPKLILIKSLLKEIKIHVETLPTLLCDNIEVTYLVKNPMLHALTKHIEINFHFVREQIATKKL